MATGTKGGTITIKVNVFLFQLTELVNTDKRNQNNDADI